MSVEAWYRSLKRQSAATADLYAYSLDKFCRDNGLTPQKLLELDAAQLNVTLNNYIDGKSSSYASNFVKAVKSWLNFNGRNVNLFVKLNSRQPAVAESEKVPTKDELVEIISVANVRTRAIIALKSRILVYSHSNSALLL